jgi:hypothetical protein
LLPSGGGKCHGCDFWRSSRYTICYAISDILQQYYDRIAGSWLSDGEVHCCLACLYERRVTCGLISSLEDAKMELLQDLGICIFELSSFMAVCHRSKDLPPGFGRPEAVGIPPRTYIPSRTILEAYIEVIIHPSFLLCSAFFFKTLSSIGYLAFGISYIILMPSATTLPPPILSPS